MRRLSSTVTWVNGLEALPNGHKVCSSSPNRLSTDLCGIVDIWIAGTYGTVTTEEQIAKDGIVGQYGEIEEWDVSQVTTMSFLFYNKRTFNADLSKWNVNNVKSLQSSKFFIPFHNNNAHQIHPYISIVMSIEPSAFFESLYSTHQLSAFLTPVSFSCSSSKMPMA